MLGPSLPTPGVCHRSAFGSNLSRGRRKAPPSDGLGRTGKVILVFRVGVEGGCQTGFFILLIFPMGIKKRLPSRMQDRRPKAVLGLLCGDWEGSLPWELHFLAVIHFSRDPHLTRLKVAPPDPPLVSRLCDEDKESSAFPEWQRLFRNPGEGTGEPRWELSINSCAGCALCNARECLSAP